MRNWFDLVMTVIFTPVMIAGYVLGFAVGAVKWGFTEGWRIATHN